MLYKCTLILQAETEMSKTVDIIIIQKYPNQIIGDKLNIIDKAETELSSSVVNSDRRVGHIADPQTGVAQVVNHKPIGKPPQTAMIVRICSHVKRSR